MIAKNINNRFITFAYSIISLILILSSCSTGIESTKKITNKDVKRFLSRQDDVNENGIDSLSTFPFSSWKQGKKFYVSDPQIKLVLNSLTGGVLEKGDTIQYLGNREENIFGTGASLVLMFDDKKGNTYSYNTSKSTKDLGSLAIPFTVDFDLVGTAKNRLVNNDYYINTSLWYNEKDDIIAGLKFVKVKIVDVLPGNRVYSLKVKFNYANKDSYVFLSTKDNSVQNRLFENIFTSTDPHKNYPTITNKNWELIINGKIAQGMTKDECRLSLGTPNGVDKIPTYAGLKELWRYEDGTYLIFMDGLLDTFRK